MAERQPVVHEMKAWCVYFDAVARGDKPFELRRDDRGGFNPGDVLHLRRFDRVTDEYTGAELWVPVTYVIDGPNQFGVREGFSVLGLDLQRLCVLHSRVAQEGRAA
jgi:hypothetical protein